MQDNTRPDEVREFARAAMQLGDRLLRSLQAHDPALAAEVGRAFAMGERVSLSFVVGEGQPQIVWESISDLETRRTIATITDVPGAR